jgi:hypothetical protein
MAVHLSQWVNAEKLFVQAKDVVHAELFQNVVQHFPHLILTHPNMESYKIINRALEFVVHTFADTPQFVDSAC